MSNKSEKQQHPAHAQEAPPSGPEIAPETPSAKPAETSSAAASAPGAAPAAAPQAIAQEEVAALKAKAAKADEYWDRIVRQAADFDNFKKRTVRDRQEAVKFANQAMLEKLVGVLDHFEMAIAAANNNNNEAQPANLDSFKNGILMIYNQFKTVLTESGLEEIDAQGKTFDPNIHEAVSQQESADVPEGQVLQQMRKGYKLRERLLRPATVIVAKKPASH
jgi:molecular chaperone GrpE